MKNHKWRVSADVPGPVRDLLLRTRKPTFELVYANSITWAYGVEMECEFQTGPQQCALTGHHIGLDHEAFTVSLNGNEYRPDGRRLFLAYSTTRTVAPAMAGDIDMDKVQPIDPIWFAAQLRLRPMRSATPVQV